MNEPTPAPAPAPRSLKELAQRTRIGALRAKAAAAQHAQHLAEARVATLCAAFAHLPASPRERRAWTAWAVIAAHTLGKRALARITPPWQRTQEQIPHRRRAKRNAYAALGAEAADLFRQPKTPRGRHATPQPKYTVLKPQRSKDV
jgi:hypothetical protein